MQVRISQGRGRMKTWMVHTLILLAFVGPCPEGQQCRHFPDSDPTNNHLSNLQWGTQAENEADKIVHGTSNQGERNGHAKLSSEDVIQIRRLYETGDYKQGELAEMYHVGQSRISYIINRKNWATV
jgi:predicted XRE-type DNA-binding protein